MSDGAVPSLASPPPYLIRTERLVIRCWEPRDGPLLKEALDTSLDHAVDAMIELEAFDVLGRVLDSLSLSR